MPRLRIDLEDDDFGVLLDLAGRERRTASDQAAVLLERALSDRRATDERPADRAEPPAVAP